MYARRINDRVLTFDFAGGLVDNNLLLADRETSSLWSQLGIPDEVVVLLPGPLNTAQEIEAYTELLRIRGWRKVGLVTSARHMRRAQALAQRHELEVDSLPADFRAATLPLPLLGLIPQASALEAVEMAVWEYLGTLSVQLVGF